MEFTISILKDQSRIPEIIKLFRTGLGETSEDHWKWRLFTDNGQLDLPFAVIVENDQHEIVGISSILCVQYQSNGKILKCLQFCDWVVHPAYRGQGLIKRIYNFIYNTFQNKDYDFIIEFPNDQSYPIFKKYNFIEEPHIIIWNTSYHLFFSHTQKNNSIYFQNFEIKDTESCPFTDKIFVSEGRIIRNTTYLKWKYDQIPDLKFRWLSIWSDQICNGYFVYTITKGRISSAVNVYDWDCPLYPDLFQFAITQLQKKGNYVSFWGRYSEEILKLFHKSRFIEKSGNTRLVLKAFDGHKWPENLMLTRIDTDY